MTECLICAETFTDPKILPCVHTFCLKCLQTYGKDNIPGDQLPCPMCRTNFTIPQAGFEGLPNNYFMNQLMNIRKMSVKEGKDNQFCDWCPDDKKVAASYFCLDCQEQCCESCSNGHKKAKVSKDHSIVGIKDKPSSKELLKMTKSYCEEHKNKEIDIYCYDCKKVSCLVCFAGQA